MRRTLLLTLLLTSLLSASDKTPEGEELLEQTSTIEIGHTRTPLFHDEGHGQD
jgi:hypothetical protein